MNEIIRFFTTLKGYSLLDVAVIVFFGAMLYLIAKSISQRTPCYDKLKTDLDSIFDKIQTATDDTSDKFTAIMTELKEINNELNNIVNELIRLGTESSTQSKDLTTQSADFKVKFEQILLKIENVRTTVETLLRILSGSSKGGEL